MSIDKDAGLLLSGGQDSVAIAYWKRPAHALTVNYGQVAFSKELEISRLVCDELGIIHHQFPTPLGKNCIQFGGGANWVPFRNQFLATIAASYFMSIGVQKILVGHVKDDTQFLDCSAKFAKKMNELLSIQEGGMSYSAPATEIKTAELVKISGMPKRVLAQTHSCNLSAIPCGECSSCKKHSDVLTELGWY